MLARLIHRIRLSHETRRAEAELHAMPAGILRDIGITHLEIPQFARAEARRRLRKTRSAPTRLRRPENFVGTGVVSDGAALRALAANEDARRRAA